MIGRAATDAVPLKWSPIGDQNLAVRDAGEPNGLQKQCSLLLNSPEGQNFFASRFTAQADNGLAPMELTDMDGDQRAASLKRNPTTDGADALARVDMRRAVNMSVFDASIATAAQPTSYLSFANNVRVAQGVHPA